MIRLAASEWRRIAAAAETAFPAEGCGLLVGIGSPPEPLRITRMVPAENLCATDRPDRFELDPRARFAVQRAVRGGVERLLGHWHSHPTGCAEPSATDLARAEEPELIWLIVPVRRDEDGHPRAGAPGAFRLDRARGRFETLAIRLD